MCMIHLRPSKHPLYWIVVDAYQNIEKLKKNCWVAEKIHTVRKTT